MQYSNHPSGIDYFKKILLNIGLAKPTRYEVEFMGKAAQLGIDMAQSLPAETVTLPSRSFHTIEEQWYGPVRNIPVASKYDSNVIITFPVGENQNERTFFELWMNKIVDPKKEQNEYGDQLLAQSTMKIVTLDESDKPTSWYTLHEAYPSNIFPISLGANMFNDYTRIQVQFEYRSYTYKAIPPPKEDH